MRRVFSVIDTTAPNLDATAELHLQIDSIQTNWAEALRCNDDRARDAMLARLAEHCQELAYKHPHNSKVMLWNGIVLAGYAKSLGGLCALQYLKLAKQCLERAISLAPNDGAAYLYLGLLYDQAPDAPYSFGNEAVAKKLLEQGLALTLNSSEQRRA